MTRVENAAELHRKGCNCAQAVACSFAKDLNVDESVLYAACEGFGGGMGCGRSICGALAGAGVVVGMFKSDGDIEHPGTTKKETTKYSSMVLKKFEEKVGALSCYEIKGSGTGKFLASCGDCIKFAVEITEEVLGL